MLEPKITTGILINKPMMMKVQLPLAAAAIPKALSTPITASAITMVVIAAPKVSAALISWLSSWKASFQPIQTSAIPPTKRKPGINIKYVMIATETKRTAMAPNVPQKIAFLRRCGGNLLAAIPITKALSPASTRSMRIIAKIAQIASMDMKSIVVPFYIIWSCQGPIPLMYRAVKCRIDDT